MTENVKVHNINVFYDLRNAIILFSNRSYDAITLVDAEINRISNILNKERSHLQRLLNKGQSKEAYSGFLRTEKKLRDINRIIQDFEYAIGNYKRKSQQLKSFLDNEIPKATVFLANSHNILSSYIGKENFISSADYNQRRLSKKKGKSFFWKMFTLIIGLFVPPLFSLQIGPIAINLGIAGLSIGLPLIQIGGVELGVGIQPQIDEEKKFSWGINVSPAETVQPPSVFL